MLFCTRCCPVRAPWLPALHRGERYHIPGPWPWGSRRAVTSQGESLHLSFLGENISVTGQQATYSNVQGGFQFQNIYLNKLYVYFNFTGKTLENTVQLWSFIYSSFKKWLLFLYIFLFFFPPPKKSKESTEQWINTPLTASECRPEGKHRGTPSPSPCQFRRLLYESSSEKKF